MQATPTLLSTHRRARLIACARLALVWAVAALFGALAPNRRHIKQRYAWLGLDGLVRMVCGLAIVRATELAHLRPVRRRARGFAPPGFRRTRPKSQNRAMTGAHLRRWFNAKAPSVCVARLLEAVSDLDAFVRRHVLRRAKRRLTKLCALVATRPPAQACIGLATSRPLPANSS